MFDLLLDKDMKKVSFTLKYFDFFVTAAYKFMHGFDFNAIVLLMTESINSLF